MALGQHRGRGSAGGLGVAVQHIGIQIDAIRPANRSCYWIHGHPREQPAIKECCQDALTEHRAQVKVALQPVRERKPQRETTQMRNLRNARERTHRPTLRQPIVASQSPRARWTLPPPGGMKACAP